MPNIRLNAKMKSNMLRRSKKRSNNTRRFAYPSCVATTLVSLLVGAFLLRAESPSAHGGESSEALQTIETSLGSIHVGRNVSPQYAKTFEPFDLTVEFQKPKGVKIAEDDLAGNYGDFNVEFLGDETRDLDEKNNVVLRRWRLYPTRRGELTLPPIPISLSFVESNDSSKSETVVALLPKQKLVVPKSDAVLKSADEITVNLNPIRTVPKLAILAVCVIAAFLLLAAGLFASRNRVVIDVKSSQVETPYERARRKLDEIKNSRIYLENDRLFYDEIDDILREYVAGVFPIKAQEMTTQEILGSLDSRTLSNSSLDGGDATPNLRDVLPNRDEIPKAPPIIEEASVAIATLEEPTIRSQLETTLTALDIVKFAKRPTTFADANRIYANVCEVVERSFSSYTKRLDELRRQLADNASSSSAGEKTSLQA